MAKLDLICRKLDLRPGQRLLDIGAGWGGLLLHAARRCGVDATGITLSQSQHDHVTRLIARAGLGDRVRMLLCDYRDLDPGQPFDKLASVGMFEHVGRASMATYWAKLHDLVRPGGLVMNHGITAAGPNDAMVGGGLGDFIEKYIIPGGELVHVSRAIRALSQAGLEMVDTENLRPHCARTLWAWPDALHQILLIRPDPDLATPDLTGARSAYSFNRSRIYCDHAPRASENQPPGENPLDPDARKP